MEFLLVVAVDAYFFCFSFSRVFMLLYILFFPFPIAVYGFGYVRVPVPTISYFFFRSSLTHAIRNKLFCCTKPKKRTLCFNTTIFRRRWDAEYVIFFFFLFFATWPVLCVRWTRTEHEKEKMLGKKIAAFVALAHDNIVVLFVSIYGRLLLNDAHTHTDTVRAVSYSSFEPFLFIYIITIIFRFVILWLLLVYSFNTIYANE